MRSGRPFAPPKKLSGSVAAYLARMRTWPRAESVPGHAAEDLELLDSLNAALVRSDLELDAAKKAVAAARAGRRQAAAALWQEFKTRLDYLRIWNRNQAESDRHDVRRYQHHSHRTPKAKKPDQK